MAQLGMSPEIVDVMGWNDLGAVPEHLNMLTKSSHFEMLPFYSIHRELNDALQEKIYQAGLKALLGMHVAKRVVDSK